MSITVDRLPLAASELGLCTVGEVLSHLRGENRLVVEILIDGQPPAADAFEQMRQTRVSEHSIYIETADPRTVAGDVLGALCEELPEADRLRDQAVDLLGQNQAARAMEQLGGCLRRWQQAHESLAKVSELLRLDISQVDMGGQTVEEMMGAFPQRIQPIRDALRRRDFVALSDALLYEAGDITSEWLKAAEAMQRLISEA